jgi:hypothetical protein
MRMVSARLGCRVCVCVHTQYIRTHNIYTQGDTKLLHMRLGMYLHVSMCLFVCEMFVCRNKYTRTHHARAHAQSPPPTHTH